MGHINRQIYMETKADDVSSISDHNNIHVFTCSITNEINQIKKCKPTFDEKQHLLKLRLGMAC